jgi:hypothetical protein
VSLSLARHKGQGGACIVWALFVAVAVAVEVYRLHGCAASLAASLLAGKHQLQQQQQ